MNDLGVSISTRQASHLLGVHESSVKRWCNADELACWHTPGGHRRIPIAALVDFAEEQRIEMPLRDFGHHAEAVWDGLEQAHREDYSALVALVYGWLSEGWTHLPARLIGYLRSEDFSLGVILDRLVGPVMRKIGNSYHDGSLSVGDEHRMTQTMRDALVSLRAENEPFKALDGKVRQVAVVGCGRGEMHELGALMVRLMLEAEGWQVVYLGQNVPTEEFATQQTRYAASLVCISLMPPMGLAEAQSLARLLGRVYDPVQPYRLALGGSALGKQESLDLPGVPIPEVKLFNRMEPFSAWIRNLAS